MGRQTLKNNLPHFEILDCTIRDGGYLNNWNFDKKLIKELYRSLSRTGVDIIEIGFRNIQKKDLGIWYSTPEELIFELFEDMSGSDICLLIDEGQVDLTLIPEARLSLVKLYRVACHKDRVVQAIKLCEEIKRKGYKVSLQLMGIVSYAQKDIVTLIQPLAESNIDYIYFADSYGSLLPQDIKKYIDWLKITEKKIGFHPHNNLQLAFANTLEAIKGGIDIVDGTVYGMGRGAGNLPLEVLIIYLEKTLNHQKYNSLPILDLIDRYFLKLNEELKWGYNLPYMLSGISEVHPNYAKNLVDQYQYNVEEMVKALDIMKDLSPVGYKKELLDKVITSGFIRPQEAGEETKHNEEELKSLRELYPVNYKKRHAGQDFLILANGASLKESKTEIDEFISRYKPVIMGANYLGSLFRPHYHAFSNKKRFVSYIDQVDQESKLLLSSFFEEEFIRDYTDREYESLVHLNRISQEFDIVHDVITSSCRTVSMLLTAVSIIMGARRIFLAGMDGYNNKELLQANKIHFYEETGETKNFNELLELHNWNELLLNKINAYLLSRNKEGLHIITPTNHKQYYNSLYNWKK